MTTLAVFGGLWDNTPRLTTLYDPLDHLLFRRRLPYSCVMVGNPGRNAVALRDDNLGIDTEDSPRKVQERSDNDNGYYCSLNGDWLAQLSLDEQGAATLHSVNTSSTPVVVRQPAIIIQPASVLEGDL